MKRQAETRAVTNSKHRTENSGPCDSHEGIDYDMGFYRDTLLC